MIRLILISLLITSAQAADLNIEPVYGFERTLQVEPKPSRYRTDVILGVRAVYGNDVIAGELEINQSNSENEANGVKVKTQNQNLLAGLRLIPLSGSFYNYYLRGGMRARQGITEVIQNGESDKTNSGVQLDPYAGTGLVINLAGILSLNASATLVFNRNAEADEQYDTQYALGFSFGFGNR
ncbi:MAG: hypothetical protein CME65_16115 [Halobacteriovoraceae bacterium]|nr:hypothetical protein [Halobacteriovoraceae bacterium]|tara:strand:- start:17415 stop:17960 length:546 start_codon:yes stop_codon:yes gene_type:complete